MAKACTHLSQIKDVKPRAKPYVHSLARYVRLSVPPWMPAAQAKDNWQTSAWERATDAAATKPVRVAADEHF